MGTRLGLITGNAKVITSVCSTDRLHTHTETHAKWFFLFYSHQPLLPHGKLATLVKPPPLPPLRQFQEKASAGGPDGFDCRNESLLLNWDSLDPGSEPEDEGGHAEAGEAANRMEQPSVLFWFCYVQEESGCAHFFFFFFNISCKSFMETKTNKQNNCTSACFSFHFYTLKHIMVQHGWRQIHW